MKTTDFDYNLPSNLIAQTPIEPRDHSRLMVLSRKDGKIEHRHFFEIIEYLRPDDVLVLNNSRVIPARLLGYKVETGGKVEVLLLRRLKPNIWEALVRPGRRLNVGTEIRIEVKNNSTESVFAKILDRTEAGGRIVQLSNETVMDKVGNVPLPPYIHTHLDDPERYQTIYARKEGSVAAPTAGLHFTPELLSQMQKKGIEVLFVTLHVGLDTFRPVKVENPHKHLLHREYCELTSEVAQKLNCARAEKRRIICVGTTTVRALEGAPKTIEGELRPFADWVDLFILPGYQFQVADALVTNFHLPRSTLLMLVSAFAGKEFISHAYSEAIQRKYSFYSFGDAMLLL
jgi:S-adenosylmethionine:tRNA ribosyltransferase-isomerase